VSAQEGAVTSQPQAVGGAGNIVSREEKIEYRDENGNILDPEQVKALEGKVSFKTRYETRTRLVDAQGNEVAEGVAPPHPDVEGSNPETVEKKQDEASEKPPTVGAAGDIGKEKSAEGKEGNTQAKPASEAQQATNKEEL
jgi:dolichyl-phosphate-mannose-protein mannosyltransferase